MTDLGQLTEQHYCLSKHPQSMFCFSFLEKVLPWNNFYFFQKKFHSGKDSLRASDETSGFLQIVKFVDESRSFTSSSKYPWDVGKSAFQNLAYCNTKSNKGLASHNLKVCDVRWKPAALKFATDSFTMASVWNTICKTYST